MVRLDHWCRGGTNSSREVTINSASSCVTFLVSFSVVIYFFCDWSVDYFLRPARLLLESFPGVHFLS